MPGEIDLRPGIWPTAFQHLHFAFAKLGMKHVHAGFDAVRRCFALRWHGGVRKAF
jgi:hypothetical protein